MNPLVLAASGVVAFVSLRVLLSPDFKVMLVSSEKRVKWLHSNVKQTSSV
jgi:hypothetical protein